MATAKKKSRAGRPPLRDTASNRAAFLDRLAEGSTAIDAAKACGFALRTAYDWRKKDEEFKAQWDEAYQIGAEALEKEALRRATKGLSNTVFWQGKPCGTKIEYSDTLLIFLLKARNPHKFCDRTRAAEIEREAARDKGDDSNTAAIAAIEALERLAAEKAATAKHEKAAA